MPGTVTVACKLPHGLVLQHQVKEKENVAVMGGGFKEVDRWNATGKTVKIAGWANSVARGRDGNMTYGYALTHGVDADFWKKWAEQNADFEPVKNKLIFAFERQQDASTEAKKHERVLSGFEPTDPDTPPVEFRRKGQEITKADLRGQ